LTSGEVVLQVEKWFAKADTFADVARESMEKKRYDFACFLAQQAVEFCLKGILIAKTGMKSYSHSLEDLTKALVATGIGIPQAVVECAKTLGEHYLQARYPDARVSEYTLEEAEQAVKCMEVTLDYLRRIRPVSEKKRR
jgi:HEPN domain-containing protein